MRVLVIRHADAEQSGDDATRSLTKDGRSQMKSAARTLRELVERVDLLATSPLARACETAKIISKAFDDVEIEEIDQLSPGAGAESLLAWLGRHSSSKTVALVGHEPD